LRSRFCWTGFRRPAIRRARNNGGALHERGHEVALGYVLKLNAAVGSFERFVAISDEAHRAGFRGQRPFHDPAKNGDCRSGRTVPLRGRAALQGRDRSPQGPLAETGGAHSTCLPPCQPAPPALPERPATPRRRSKYANLCARRPVKARFWCGYSALGLSSPTAAKSVRAILFPCRVNLPRRPFAPARVKSRARRARLPRCSYDRAVPEIRRHRIARACTHKLARSNSRVDDRLTPTSAKERTSREVQVAPEAEIRPLAWKVSFQTDRVPQACLRSNTPSVHSKRRRP
jgi:hypothetical protein